MKTKKLKRTIVTALFILICYMLQCTVFPNLALASIKPNLMIVVTAAFGFMRGTKEGMLIGFFSGLLMDIQFGSILGFYALIYLLVGYVNGLFEQMYFDEDIKLPLILIAASEFVYGLVIYVLMFLLRSEFDFLHYIILCVLKGLNISEFSIPLSVKFILICLHPHYIYFKRIVNRDSSNKRAHLLTTRKGAVVLPVAVVRSPRGNSCLLRQVALCS